MHLYGQKWLCDYGGMHTQTPVATQLLQVAALAILVSSAEIVTGDALMTNY
jgi:hypothetical protein